jgi:hypothetical protein
MEDDENECKYTDKRTGKKYRFKLVWTEGNNDCCIALGNGYVLTTSGIIIFSGSEGIITISPNADYVIK